MSLSNGNTPPVTPPTDSAADLAGMVQQALTPGVKSTEFYLSVAAAAAPYVLAWLDKLDGDVAVWASVAVAGLYAGYRTWLKRRSA